MKGLASVQATTLDIAWIRDRMVCFGARPAERCYRAVLAAEGPPDAFATEAERVQPLLDGHAGFLNALGQPGALGSVALQALVRAQPTDLAAYAARLEARAEALPPRLAREALADAAWARQKGPELGLLTRRSYLVIPAESLLGEDLGARLRPTRSLFGGWLGGKLPLGEASARVALDTRCSGLLQHLRQRGVWAERLDDPDLVRLFYACCSRRRDGRFEHDLRTCAAPLPEGPS